ADQRPETEVGSQARERGVCHAGVTQERRVDARDRSLAATLGSYEQEGLLLPCVRRKQVPRPLLQQADRVVVLGPELAQERQPALRLGCMRIEVDTERARREVA